jgi:hypothetical protein
MRKTSTAAAVLSLCCLPLVAAAAPTALGHGKAIASPGASPDATCYSQAGTDTGNAIVSQNFESSFDQYDAQAADDFKVKKGKVCNATGLNVTGQYFNGSGPARDVDVTFYKNSGGHPGAATKAYANLAYTNGASFNVKFPSKAKLKGTNWVSAVANLDFGAGGEWGWEVQSEIKGNEANWQNPGGGFGLCPSWDTITNCIGVSGDFMFDLVGKLK